MSNFAILTSNFELLAQKKHYNTNNVNSILHRKNKCIYPQVTKNCSFTILLSASSWNLTIAVFHFYVTRPKPQRLRKNFTNLFLPTDIENHGQHIFEVLSIPLYETLVSRKKWSHCIFFLSERESCVVYALMKEYYRHVINVTTCFPEVIT